MKQRVKEYIIQKGLNKQDRHKVKNYARIILAAMLRNDKDNFTSLVEIAQMMDRTHATVINMMKNYEMLQSYSDFREMEKRIKKELDFQTLEERILKVDNMADLHWLQEEVKKNLQH